jgi:hypothetical protein
MSNHTSADEADVLDAVLTRWAAGPGRRVGRQRDEPSRAALGGASAGRGARRPVQVAGTGDLAGALAGQGYEPLRDDAGTIRLRNRPFHQLAEAHREVVCGMNLGLIEGIVAGLDVAGARPALDPSPGHCCVAIGAEQP